MSRTVFANQSGAVETQNNRKILNRYVVDDIIMRPLHKRRIDIAERLQSVFSHPSGEGNRMSFGNTDIESAFRHFLHQYIHRTAAGHGGSDTDNLRVGFGKFHQCISEYVLEKRGHSFGVGNETFAGDGIEFAGSMPFGGVLLCRSESFSFDSMQMQDFRSLHIFDVT